MQEVYWCIFQVYVWKQHVVFKPFCQLIISELDECESDPCENGGTCEDEINAYNCVCAPGYNGTQCDSGRHNIALEIMTSKTIPLLSNQHNINFNDFIHQIKCVFIK